VRGENWQKCEKVWGTSGNRSAWKRRYFSRGTGYELRNGDTNFNICENLCVRKCCQGSARKRRAGKNLNLFWNWKNALFILCYCDQLRRYLHFAICPPTFPPQKIIISCSRKSHCLLVGRKFENSNSRIETIVLMLLAIREITMIVCVPPIRPSTNNNTLRFWQKYKKYFYHHHQHHHH